MYTMEYYSAISRNTFESILMRWMNLEPIIQSQSERKTQISYINANIWNLERWCWCTYLQGSNGDADRENRLVDTAGKEWVGRIERTAWKHIHYHIRDSRWGFAVWHGELPRWVGVGREREGGSGGRGHVYTWGWFMLIYGRNQHSIIKQLSSNYKKERLTPL